MRITLNGEPRELPAERVTVGDVLGLLALSPEARGVAVALDGTVVPRGRWAETRVEAGQRVEVLTAVQGG